MATPSPGAADRVIGQRPASRQIPSPMPTAIAPPAAVAAPPDAGPTPAATADSAAPSEFSATLGGIVYTADRQIALIDGQMLIVGDTWNGAQITRITPTTVYLRDPAGREYELTTGVPDR
jgi:hypothetical protein